MNFNNVPKSGLNLVITCSMITLVSFAPAQDLNDSTRAGAQKDELPDIGARSGGHDWPWFLGPDRNGKSAEQGLQSPWPPAGPPIRWRRAVGAGYGIGSVSQGRYFHFHRRVMNNPRGDGPMVLSCFHAETGEELWRFEYSSDYEDMLGYDNGPRCSPVVEGDRVYIYGPAGMLHCIRASDGQMIWKIDTLAKFNVVPNFFGVGSTPVLDGDLLICMVGGSPPGSPGLYESGGRIVGNGSGIVAFDKWTGAVRYQITNELASYASPQLATIDGRRWGLVFARGGLVGFDPRTGNVDFQYPWRATLLESVNASTPVVVGNEVFISETYQIGSSLLAVRPGGYEIVWRDDRRRRDKAFKAHWNTPIHVDGYLYGCSGRNPPDAELRCIRWKTGEVMWKHAWDPPERSSLLYVDGHFVCLGEYGRLELIRVDPEQYNPVSQVRLRDDAGQPLLRYPCWAAPILARGLMYLRGRGQVICMELIPEASRAAP